MDSFNRIYGLAPLIVSKVARKGAPEMRRQIVVMEKLGQLIRNRRKAAGLTREQVARAAGIAVSLLSAVENGLLLRDEVERAGVLDRIDGVLDGVSAQALDILD